MTSHDQETGSVSTEFAVVMAAFLTAFMLIVVMAGRIASAENDVANAAQEAARAASLQRQPDLAADSARQTAAANLANTGLSCASGFTVDVDTSRLQPGGTVTVTVACTTPFSDVAALAVPGTRTFTSTAVEVVDTYRSDP